MALQPGRDLAHARANNRCNMSPSMLSWQEARFSSVPASQPPRRENGPVYEPQRIVGRVRQGAIKAGQSLPNPFAKALRPRAAPCCTPSQKGQLGERVGVSTIRCQVTRGEFRVVTFATPCSRNFAWHPCGLYRSACHSHQQHSTSRV